MCAILIGLIGTALVLRKSAGGLRNVFSLTYWRARMKGEDLYNPAKNLFKRGSRDYPEVVLTIDDGPHESSIGSILDTLKENKATATFFVVGSRVKLHPEFLRRMIAEGHEVGNHTEDHLRLDTLSEAKIRYELDSCEADIERATGRRATLFRPPGMRYNARVVRVWTSDGYTMVDYNVGASDFVATAKDHLTGPALAKLQASPQEVANRVLSQVQNGSIILLHDDETTAKALPIILSGLAQQGYQLRSTSQMLEHVPNAHSLVANPVVSDAAGLKLAAPKVSRKGLAVKGVSGAPASKLQPKRGA